MEEATGDSAFGMNLSYNVREDTGLVRTWEIPIMSNIIAIYENGIFRPTGPVDLPEGSTVRIEPMQTSEPQADAHLDRVYEILSRRYDGGESDTAARHNDHQP